MGRREMFADLVAALDAMAVKELIRGSLHYEGCVCALGSMPIAAGLDDDTVSAVRAAAYAYEVDESQVEVITSENDIYFEPAESDAARWTRMRAWAQQQLEACS